MSSSISFFLSQLLLSFSSLLLSKISNRTTLTSCLLPSTQNNFPSLTAHSLNFLPSLYQKSLIDEQPLFSCFLLPRKFPPFLHTSTLLKEKSQPLLFNESPFFTPKTSSKITRYNLNQMKSNHKTQTNL